MARRPPPWLWSVLIRDYGPPDPTLKLCLHTIRTFMDANGDAFPSQTTIAGAASLTDRVVRSKLKKAERLKWLSVNVAGHSGQGWRRHGYQTCIPDSVPLTDKQEQLADCQESRVGAPDDDRERAEPCSSPSPVTPVNVRNDVPRGAEPDAPTCGTSTQKVRNHVPTNSDPKYSKKYSSEGHVASDATARVKDAQGKKPEPGIQPHPMADTLRGIDPFAVAPEVLQEAKKPEPKPERDLKPDIRQLLDVGEPPEVVHKLLASRGCTLEDVLREAMT